MDLLPGRNYWPASVQATEFKDLLAAYDSVGRVILLDVGLSCRYPTAWKFLLMQTTQPTVKELLKQTLLPLILPDHKVPDSFITFAPAMEPGFLI